MRRRVLVALTLLLTGCASASYSLPSASLTPPADLRGPRVEGADCTFTFAGGATRTISLAQAMAHALETTGADTIGAMQVETRERMFERCLIVRGVAIRGQAASRDGGR